MNPNHINKTLAESVMGAETRGSGKHGLIILCGEDQDYWSHGNWNPATDANHLNQCIAVAAKDDNLWRMFSNRLWRYCEDRDDCTIPAALLLPTLTLATLLCEAYEETL